MFKFCCIITSLIFMGCSDYKLHNLTDDVNEPSEVIVDSADPEPEVEPEPETEPDPVVEEDTAVIEEPEPDPPPEYPDS